ncbi:MAG: FkbM family methyltransferase [Ilumatobacter sp.]|uniref:FkbM family methyltransferase n=1 Tax=Ilumatobacter sp. TaxID=1967498 RepID=UPI003918D8F1
MFEAVAGFADPHEEFERILRRVFETALEPGDGAIDAGAHVGKHTVPFALAVGPTGWVAAIEPLPWAAERLRARLDVAGLTPFVSVHQSCVGAESAKSIRFHEVRDHPGWSAKAVRSHATDLVEHDVPQLTIDDVSNGRPTRVIKIDVEGGELDVLLGARDTLRRWRPVVHAELVAGAIEANSWDAIELLDLLHEHGYEVFDVIGNELTEENRDGYIHSPGPIDHFGGFDLVAIHKSDPARSDLTRCLLSSFGSERLDLERHRVPELIGPLPAVACTLDEPAAVVVDSVVGFREDLLVGPQHPLPSLWPSGTSDADKCAIFWATSGAVLLDFNSATLSSLERLEKVELPVGAGQLDLDDDHCAEIVVATPLKKSAKHAQTLCEFDFGRGFATGIVRITMSGELEIVWEQDGRTASIDRVPCTHLPSTKITLSRKRDSYTLTASGGQRTVVSQVRLRACSGTLSVQVGRRAGSIAQDPVAKPALSLSASLAPASSAHLTELSRSAMSISRRGAKAVAHRVPGAMNLVRAIRRALA